MDGNFQLEHHLNLSHKNGLASWIGDAGFWAVKKTFDEYISKTGSVPDPEDKVCARKPKSTFLAPE
jgi:hypothetical protein